MVSVGSIQLLPSVSFRLRLCFPLMAGDELTPLQVRQTRVVCGKDETHFGGEFDTASTFATSGEAASSRSAQSTQMQINRLSRTRNLLEFELHYTSASFVNALRRLLVAQVPTMAIDRVYVRNNTSHINDETLAHRVGLVPIQANANQFADCLDEDGSAIGPFNESNCLVFSLCVSYRDKQAAAELLDHGNTRAVSVYSGDLHFLSGGSDWPPEEEENANKLTQFQQRQQMRAFPVHDDILLAKLGPGQELELHAVAVKGNGNVHAKWSPVGTAWYRLVPEIKLLRKLSKDEAQELARRTGECGCFSNVAGRDADVIANRRGCAQCREKVRELSGQSDWHSVIQLRKLKHAFIFTVESTGCIPADELFIQALQILRKKCSDSKDSL